MEKEKLITLRELIKKYERLQNENKDMTNSEVEKDDIDTSIKEKSNSIK